MTQREDAAVAPAALDDLVAWFERDAAEQEAPGNEEIDIRNAATLRGYIAAITELRQRVAAAEAKYEACKLQAQCHAQEARTANATIAEIYKAVTGSTGEPGNWNGAQPVIAALAERDRRIAELTQERA